MQCVRVLSAIETFFIWVNLRSIGDTRAPRDPHSCSYRTLQLAFSKNNNNNNYWQTIGYWIHVFTLQGTTAIKVYLVAVLSRRPRLNFTKTANTTFLASFSKHSPTKYLPIICIGFFEFSHNFQNAFVLIIDFFFCIFYGAHTKHIL